MAVISLNRLRALREALMLGRIYWMRWRGVRAPANIQPSLSSRFEPAYPGAIEIGADTLISFKTLIYTHDPLTGEDRPVRIGARCFIGGGAMILPGVTIGDECIVGGGAVVFEDVPARCIVGGNPARVLRRDIEVGRFGRLKSADERAAAQQAAAAQPPVSAVA